MRKFILTVHLVLGISSALFVIVLGLSGAVMAFENDYDHWFNPELWYVRPTGTLMSQQALLDIANRAVAPLKISAVAMQDGRADLSEDFSARNGNGERELFVNPYDGSILGARDEAPRSFYWVNTIHQLHLRLVKIRIGKTDVGKIIVEIAGIEVLLLIPTGFVLWWRRRRGAINWKTPWRLWNWDLHNVIGIYAGAFLLIATVTGFFISFDQPLYWATRSGPPEFARMIRSVPPATPQPPLNLDDVLKRASDAIPGARPSQVLLPSSPTGSYVVFMRVPEETSRAVYSKVLIEQYSGKVLRADDFRTAPQGYRAVRFNRSLHNGDVLGTPTHIVMAASSALMAVLAVTGPLIWWGKRKQP